MAINNTVRVTLKIRNDLAANWSNNNPILAQGEFGLENNSFLLKVGDGTTAWNSLPYLNKLDQSYFVQGADGTITFNSTFQNILTNVIVSSSKDANGIGTIEGPLRIDYGTDSLNRPNIPDSGDNLAIVNKYYVDRAIALAGHLKKEIVTTLPAASAADPYTIYMVLDTSVEGSDKYKEYMVINDTNNQPQMTQIGDTSVDLKNLVTGSTTPGHLIAVAADGSLVDAGVDASSAGQLGIATTTILGGVKSGTGADGDDRIIVNSTTGFMTLSHVPTSLLYVPAGDTLILEGGNSAGGVVSG